jgi:hypothetical protein
MKVAKKNNNSGRLFSVIPVVFLAILIVQGVVLVPAYGETNTLKDVRQRKERTMGSEPRTPGVDSVDLGPPIQTGKRPKWAKLSPASDESWYYGVGKAGLKEENN